MVRVRTAVWVPISIAVVAAALLLSIVLRVQPVQAPTIISIHPLQQLMQPASQPQPNASSQAGSERSVSQPQPAPGANNTQQTQQSSAPSQQPAGGCAPPLQCMSGN